MEHNLEILVPGPLSTVQDLGRYGLQHLGFSPTGAADAYAVEVGNRLLGNDPGAASIEMTLGNAVVRFGTETAFVLTGADADATLDGNPIDGWHAYTAPPAGVLSVGQARNGVRVYLCVDGGIDVDPAYGSRSTDLVAGIGGYKGRALQPSDLLPLGLPAGATSGRLLHAAWRPPPGPWHVIRTMPGPHHLAFTEPSLRRFFTLPYRVTPRADRTGLFLDGSRLSHLAGHDVLSEGVTAGSIQVTGSGQPLVLLAEHRSVGGYTRIGTVISVDLPRLGQARPGDHILFVPVGHAAAQAAYRAWREMCAWAVTVSPPASTQRAAITPTGLVRPTASSLAEWITVAVNDAAAHMADERLPLMQSDAGLLHDLMDNVDSPQGRASLHAPCLRIHPIMPDAAYPELRANAPATGTLLAPYHAHLQCGPVAPGGIVAAVWSPGVWTVLIAMHPVTEFTLRSQPGSHIREGALLAEGFFATTLQMAEV